ncbi:MAG: hypothetical protein AB7N76_35470 [Planctomycetota bacterium]
MGMKEGYAAAAKLSRKQVEQEAPQDLEHLARTQVVVVSGQYDRGQEVFDLCEIPNSVISPAQVAKVKLDPDQVLFVNCPGHIPERGLARVKSFVQHGGLLVTTDWALKHVIETTFPGVVRYNQRATADDVVRVVFEQVQDAFLEGLISPGEDPLWWLEGSSYPIEVLDPRARVLVTSEEMRAKYGQAPIVVTFEVGEGKVYHLTSHFYLQRTETRTKRHAQQGTAYAQEKGYSLSAAEAQDAASFAGCTVTEAQAAYTSARSLTNLVIEQGRRVKKRKG